jgi:hypothetical protein
MAQFENRIVESRADAPPGRQLIGVSPGADTDVAMPVLSVEDSGPIATRDFGDPGHRSWFRPGPDYTWTEKRQMTASCPMHGEAASIPEGGVVDALRLAPSRELRVVGGCAALIHPTLWGCLLGLEARGRILNPSPYA